MVGCLCLVVGLWLCKLARRIELFAVELGLARPHRRSSTHFTPDSLRDSVLLLKAFLKRQRGRTLSGRLRGVRRGLHGLLGAVHDRDPGPGAAAAARGGLGLAGPRAGLNPLLVASETLSPLVIPRASVITTSHHQ